MTTYTTAQWTAVEGMRWNVYIYIYVRCINIHSKFELINYSNYSSRPRTYKTWPYLLCYTHLATHLSDMIEWYIDSKAFRKSNKSTGLEFLRNLDYWCINIYIYIYIHSFNNAVGQNCAPNSSKSFSQSVPAISLQVSILTHCILVIHVTYETSASIGGDENAVMLAHSRWDPVK